MILSAFALGGVIGYPSSCNCIIISPSSLRVVYFINANSNMQSVVAAPELRFSGEAVVGCLNPRVGRDGIDQVISVESRFLKS